jgi:hypothetical protein
MVIARHLAKGRVDLTEFRVPTTEVAHASATASQSCRRSTRTASTGRLCRRKRITDALGVQDAQTESKPDDEGDDDTGQAS